VNRQVLRARLRPIWRLAIVVPLRVAVVIAIAGGAVALCQAQRAALERADDLLIAEFRRAAVLNVAELPAGDYPALDVCVWLDETHWLDCAIAVLPVDAARRVRERARPEGAR
jgi:hypothetical protein